MQFDKKRLLQVGVVVKNMDEAVKFYEETFGFGPFKRIHLEGEATKYYGKNVFQSTNMALCKIGDIYLELIEMVDGQSIHCDYMAKHGEGCDHIAFEVDDLAAAVAEFKAKGFNIIETDDKNIAYLDCDKIGGLLVELIYMAPGVSFD